MKRTSNTIEITQVDESVKKAIVRQVESGQMSQMEAAREYGLSRSAIQKWLKQYGKLRFKTKVIKVTMKDEKEKLKELRQALGDAHLKIRYYEKMLEVAKKEYGMDIKKKLATTVSELSRKKDVKSSDCAE